MAVVSIFLLLPKSAAATQPPSPQALISNTGRVTPPASPSSAPGGGVTGYAGAAAAPESVIGDDGRGRVTATTTYPNRAIVYVTRNGTAEAQHCTAVFVGKDVLLTAGHCLHSGGSTGGWYPINSLRFFPGRDGASEPYGYCTARTGGFYALRGWVADADERFDVGFVKLNCTKASKLVT